MNRNLGFDCVCLIMCASEGETVLTVSLAQDQGCRVCMQCSPSLPCKINLTEAVMQMLV